MSGGYPVCPRCHKPADPLTGCVPGRFHGDPERGWRRVDSEDERGWRPAFGQLRVDHGGQHVMHIDARSAYPSEEFVRPYNLADAELLWRLWERWHRHPWDLFWVQQFEPDLYERWRVARGGPPRAFYFGGDGKAVVR